MVMSSVMRWRNGLSDLLFWVMGLLLMLSGLSQTHLNTEQAHPVNSLLPPGEASPYRASGFVLWPIPAGRED
jgi:hypothetical protein